VKKFNIIVLTLATLIGISSYTHAEVAFLQPYDFVGFTFWLVSIGCLAATAFFFLESGLVAPEWRASIIVAGLITGIAFIHSMYMRNMWVTTGDSPTIYRHIDWLITMPLLIIEFYLVLSAVKKISSSIFWKLLIGALIMVSGSYAGQAGYIHSFLGFVIWMTGWIFILYELSSGNTGKLVARSSNNDLVTSFEIMRMIVTIGWTIYPLGYVFGYLTGGLDSNTLNVIYNFGDFINKIGFGIVIWVVARQHK
jgi:bacteriorhodopsin|tara:strand:- start:1460 stop:2215 length:756 start_codon:yes stop_codon:yes gene_type:complete